MSSRPAAALVLLVAFGCSESKPRPTKKPPVGISDCPIQLRDVTRQTGISFIHTDGHSGQYYIVETITAGIALLDYDGDGLIDIYFLNGAPLKGLVTPTIPRNALYRNEGNWHFRDVTQEAGVGNPGFGLGVAVADYDNDGDPDIYVNNYGPNVLYRNEGDGTFTDATSTAAVGGGNWVGAGACFVDADGDGRLDLYVGNYVNFTYENHVVHGRQGFKEYVGPRDYQPVPDLLFHNNGDGTFTGISAQSGVTSAAGTSMGIVSADYDNDGDSDIFVLNDVSGNFFFVNDAKGHFEESGVLNGTAYNMYGDELGSMGVDCGDYDNDGYLDFLMTSYQSQLPVLYRNLGNGQFVDATLTTKAGQGAFPYVNWGVGMVDFDNDSHLDLFMACGHLQDKVDHYDNSTGYEVRNIVLMNDGTGKFEDVSTRCGDGLAPKRSSRGAGFDDLDNDGDIDIVVLNSRREPTIIKNVSSRPNHWLQICLRGTKSNRDGVGSQVRVTAGKVKRLDEVHSGRGYQSSYGTRLQFGLGDQNRVDRIEVRWLGGGVDVLQSIPADQCITIVEGAYPESEAKADGGVHDERD